MSLSGFVVFAVGIWATYASIRTIRRIGLRRFSVAVGRLGWDLGKVALGVTAVVAGAVVGGAARGADEETNGSGLNGPDLMDINDPDNYYLRPQSPLYIGIAEDLDNENREV